MKVTRRSLIKTLAFTTAGLSFPKTILGAGSYLISMKDDEKKEVVKYKGYFDKYHELDVVYDNHLKTESDVAGFKMEGHADISFPNERLRMQNILDHALKQKANFVYWCPEEFPADISISWDFYPIEEPGLCIMFFAANGIKGEDIFDLSLKKRSGEYKQYHHGDINAYHVSYFRRNEKIRDFQLCNLRKSYGHNMVIQGADPIPSTQYSNPPYQIRIVKVGPTIEFFINDLTIFEWVDDGKTYGPVLGKGKIGFRQMAPLVAEYSNLKVVSVARK